MERLWKLRTLRVAQETGKHPFERNGYQPYAHQVAPPGPWWLWLLQAGRGAGKTAAAAYYLDRYMTGNAGHRAGIVAPTLGDAVESCFRGESGLLAFNPRLRITGSLGRFRILWPNGSVALLFGAYTPEDVERLRAGGNRYLDWWEELAAWRKLDDAYKHARFGLRLGDSPRAVASTTPKPRRLLKELRSKPGVVISRATTADNPHLDPDWRRMLYEEYGGTTLGRQELGGEFVEEIEGALWSRAMIEATRASSLPPLGRIVIAIDPSEGKPGSDEQAIAVCAHGLDHLYYVLHTEGMRVRPLAWCRRAAYLLHRYDADRLVYEGGEWVADLLRQVDDELPLKPARTAASKRVRAEPVAALWEQGKARIYGSQPEVEDQMCSYLGLPGEPSPDRLDTVVHGLNELRGDTRPQWGERDRVEEPRGLGYGIDEARRKRRGKPGGLFGDEGRDLSW